jgi:hypothetical protein
MGRFRDTPGVFSRLGRYRAQAFKDGNKCRKFVIETDAALSVVTFRPGIPAARVPETCQISPFSSKITHSFLVILLTIPFPPDPI